MLRFNIFLVFLILLHSGSSLALPQSSQQVESAVETWLKHGLTDNRPDAQVRKLEPHYADGEIVAYIASLSGGGYCICGADDVLIPVYLYVPKGEYDPEDSNLRSILAEIAQRLAFIRKELSTGSATLDPYEQDFIQRKQEWNELLAGRALHQTVDEKNRDLPLQMILPLTCAWEQGPPYNDDCPNMPGESPSKVGCVATAMAQIMYYWQWPPTGYSQHIATFHYRTSDTWHATALATDPGITSPLWDDRLSWTSMDGGYLQMRGNWDDSWLDHAIEDFHGDDFETAINTLYLQLTPVSQSRYANFAGTSYNFDLMSDVHPNGTIEGDQAVAQLCYHAGIAMDMNWGFFSSSAFTENTGYAYEHYFRYDPDHVWGNLDTDLIEEEIQWLRPVQIRGADITTAGHSWVICGYDHYYLFGPYYWMNMGWGSDHIGWCRIDEIPGGFEVGNQHTTGIAPASVVRFVGPFNGPNADGSPANPYGHIADAVSETPDNGTIILKAGTDAYWNGGGIMSRPVTVKGKGVTISYQ